jgi:hypothetical protein
MKKAVKSAVADLRFDAPGPPLCETREDYRREIENLWRRSQENFIQIGRYLNEAREKLPHGEFEEMIRHDLPFSPSVARQIRAAAELVDSGELPADLLPKSYSTVYQLSSLTPIERQKAVEEGLVKPDIRREDIMQFKRQIRLPPEVDQTTALRARLERLHEERRRIEAEIVEIEEKLRELQSE